MPLNSRERFDFFEDWYYKERDQRNAVGTSIGMFFAAVVAGGTALFFLLGRLTKTNGVGFIIGCVFALVVGTAGGLAIRWLLASLAASTRVRRRQRPVVIDDEYIQRFRSLDSATQQGSADHFYDALGSQLRDAADALQRDSEEALYARERFIQWFGFFILALAVFAIVLLLIDLLSKLG